MNINISVTSSDIADSISREEAKELIREMDQSIAEWDATEELFMYFVSQMRLLHKENLIDEETSDPFDVWIVDLINKKDKKDKELND